MGLEREWSGHASGPEAHFAGFRTFTLLGGMAGLAGWLWALSFQPLAIVLLAGATALVVVAYVAASRRHVDGTTEVAALVVLAAGVLAGTGSLVLSSAVIALTTLLLIEKSRLHATIARIDDTGLRAGIRFAVMAVVVLPLLPEGPFGPLGGIKPRQLWLFVLLFSGISFVGYVARRIAGAGRGYALAGLLGGLVSSTAVAFTFSRTSRRETGFSFPLAVGVVGACTLMNLRVLLASLVLRPSLALALVPYLAAPFLIGALIFLIGWKRGQRRDSSGGIAQSPPDHLGTGNDSAFSGRPLRGLSGTRPLGADRHALVRGRIGFDGRRCPHHFHGERRATTDSGYDRRHSHRGRSTLQHRS